MKVLGITVPIFTTDFETTVKDYETLMGESTQKKFHISSIGISVAKIGGILIIGGSEEALTPLKQIRATFVVDSIEDYFSYLVGSKATIIQPPTPTPTGQNMIAKGKDGVVFEYVELRP
jgi:predicted enzyme related to lactoylglutathione lyase